MTRQQQSHPWPLRATALGASYFAMVFAVGFALGIVRVLWLVPRLGERTAELAETPFMIAASFLAARFLVRRCRPALVRREAVAMGMIALALLLVFEFTVVLAVRGLSMAAYLAARDPISGTAYVLALVLFMLMPVLLVRLAQRSDEPAAPP